MGPVNGSLYDDDAEEGVIAEDSLDIYLVPPVKGSEYADADAEDTVEAEGRCLDVPISSRASMQGRVLSI